MQKSNVLYAWPSSRNLSQFSEMPHFLDRRMYGKSDELGRMNSKNLVLTKS